MMRLRQNPNHLGGEAEDAEHAGEEGQEKRERRRVENLEQNLFLRKREQKKEERKGGMWENPSREQKGEDANVKIYIILL